MQHPNPVTTRHGTLDDLEALTVLFDSYRRFYEATSDLDSARTFLSERLKKQDSVILVAERDERIVGFTQLYPSFSSVSMKRVWILNDLFVDPQARGAGIGRSLIQVAETHARATHSKGLVLATKNSNAPAKKLYDSAGWVLDVVFDHYTRFF